MATSFSLSFQEYVKLEQPPESLGYKDEIIECKSEEHHQLESCRNPIEVLVTPEGQVLSITTQDQPDMKPEVMVAKSGDQGQILSNTNKQLLELDINFNKTDVEDQTNLEVQEVHTAVHAQKSCGFKYRCKICQVWFSRAHLLAKHLKTHVKL